MKKICWIVISICAGVLSTQAQVLPQQAVKQLAVNETTDKSTISLKTTSDQGIKDLYEPDITGINTKGPRLNPRAVSFVEDYMEKYSKDLIEMKGWGLPYFNMMDAVFIKYNMPVELKYLAVIESELKSTAKSWAGAVGPWQLMPSTAISLGLKVNKKVDERRNYIKSTNAAAKYLRDLYVQFDDWLLVVAAYNCGSGNVLKAIRKSGSRNFWNLQYYLPTESRNHVKKFIGTHYIMEGQGGLTTLTKSETDAHYGNSLYTLNRKLNEEEKANAKTQNISGKYHSSIIAKNIMMDMADFSRYNPDFDRVMASANNSYDLQLPADKMELFNTNKYQILNESVQLLLNGAAVKSKEVSVSAK